MTRESKERRYPAHYDKTHHRPRMFPVRFSHVLRESRVTTTHYVQSCVNEDSRWFDIKPRENGHNFSSVDYGTAVGSPCTSFDHRMLCQ